MLKCTTFTAFRKYVSFETLFFLLILFVLAPKNIFHLPANSLDESWVLAINLAVKNEFVFGKDFAFTYGPLGYLWTGLITYVSKAPIIIFQLFLFACLAFIVSFYLKQIKTKISQAFFLLLIIVFPIMLDFEKAILLLVYFLFFVFYHIRQRKRFAVFVVGFLALLAFFIKLNTGLLLTILLVPYLVFLNILKIEKIRFTFIFMFVYLILIFFLSHILRVNLYSYVVSSLDIINYYNDSMIIPAPLNVLFLTGMILLLNFVVFMVDLRNILKDKTNFFIAAYVAIGLYVIFKAGFVRADGHVLIFLFYNIFLFSLLAIFINSHSFRKLFIYVLVFSGLVSLISVKLTLPDKCFMDLMVNKISSVPYSDLFLDTSGKYFEYRSKLGKSQAEIPVEPLKKLKQGTVDIIPWDISYIYFNDLNYNPRPVIQSYGAYSEYLDRLNAEKYSSGTAPDYVLYTIGSIDYRHPFWDESQTKMAMLTNYEVVDNFLIPAASNSAFGQRDFIMLGKRTPALQMTETGSQSFLYKIGDTLRIPASDKLLYLYADFQYTLWGKIRRFLYQPNRLAVETFYEDNLHDDYYIAILPLIKGGVLANKRVITNDEAKLFFETHGEDNANVQGIRFTPKSLGIKESVIITLKEYEIN